VVVVICTEHIWRVTVKAKGLSGNRDKGIPPGCYRLCLTNTDISLIRLCSDKPDVVVPVGINTIVIILLWGPSQGNPGTHCGLIAVCLFVPRVRLSQEQKTQRNHKLA